MSKGTSPKFVPPTQADLTKAIARAKFNGILISEVFVPGSYNGLRIINNTVVQDDDTRAAYLLTVEGDKVDVECITEHSPSGQSSSAT